jgi:hypothetical protein
MFKVFDKGNALGPAALPAAGLALVIGFGLFEGRWTNRWSQSEAVQEATQRLAQVPRTVGDWESIDQELEERQVKRAEITGYVQRHYTNRRTGEQLDVLLVCGPAMPVALHSPDVCYRGAGYVLQKELDRRQVNAGLPSGPAEFRVGDFVKEDDAVPDRLRIYWSWGAAGKWQAPDNPRLHYADHDALFKVYIVRRKFRADEAPAADIAPAFLRLLLPKVQKALFESPVR